MTRHHSRNIFISAGAGRNQIPLIEAAKNLGFSVTCIDRNPDAPGFSLCSKRIICSASDADQIIKKLENLYSKEDCLAGILSRSFGKTALAAAETARKFRLRGPDPDAVRFFQNKRIYKKKSSQQGISVPRILEWNHEESLNQFLDCGCSVIVKPSSEHGKKGIILLESKEEIRHFAEKHPDDGSLLAEEFIKGNEVTVLASVFDKKLFIHSITDKITLKEPPLFAEIMHRHPSLFADRNTIAVIKSQLEKLVTLSGLDQSPVVAEFLISGKDVFLVEAAPEIGGEYLADRLFPSVTGSDYFEYLIKKLSGKSAKPVSVSDFAEKSCIIAFIPPVNGKKIVFPDYLRELPEFVFSEILNSPCNAGLTGNASRMAVIGLKSDSGSEYLEELYGKIMSDSLV